ncbi:MAG TPA: hypothetical protein VMW69_16990, partial [Spirochaetia bacterium]|nr:hypothetical protein [Spirochaetia bacterium]
MKRIVWAALLAALLPFVAQRSAAQDSANSVTTNQEQSALLAQISSSEGLSKRTSDAFNAV